MNGIKKSFRIDDLLTDKPKHEELNQPSTSSVKKPSDKKELLKAGKSFPNQDQEDASNSSSSGESTSSGSKNSSKGNVSPVVPGGSNGPVARHSVAATNRKTESFGVGGSPPVPPYQPKLPNASHPFEMDMGNKNLPFFLPYGMESYKMGRNYLGLPPQSQAFADATQGMLSAIQGGYVPPMGFDHGVLAQLMAKPVVNGMVDRRLVQERLHYPMMYTMGRPMYSTACKRKGGQIRFNTAQTTQLERAFLQQKYLNAHDRKKLAVTLGLSDRQVKTWFQNRRAKMRKGKDGSGAEEDSGTPQDLRTVKIVQYDNLRNERTSDVKTG